MDPEPGRCKRTDGKKWRCSRDVVAGHKYCDRHIHRGRNRSRKPVETATTTTTTTTPTTAASSFVLGEELGHEPNNNHFFSSGSSQHLHLSHQQSCSSEMKQESNNNSNNHKRPYEAHNGFSNGRSDDGHILRHFIDDWPRSSDSTSSPMSSSTCHLSISMPGNGNTSSDVSLKLSTGNEEEEEEENMRNNNNEREQLNWWNNGGNHQNMGGPLAEALRSASSTSSVLHQMGISTQVFH